SQFLATNIITVDTQTLPFSLQGSIKLYKVPLRVVYEPRNIRCFATKSTAALPGTQKEDDIFRTVSAPKNLSRSSNSMNEFERELQEFFLQVKTMLKKGNIDGAMNLLQANYKAVKEQIAGGDNGMEQAAILDVIALGYMGVGDFEFVECLLDMLNDPIVLYEQVDTRILGGRGRYEEAMAMYERSLEILEGLFGLGNLFIREGKAADAENCLYRILRTYAKLYGDHDGRVGIAMCSLANAKCAKGSLDEAVELHRKGLQVIKDSKYIAMDDEVVEKIRIELADLYYIAGREHEGRELLKECLLTTEKYNGNEHPSSVTHLLNLATSYSRSKNFVEAERLQREGLRIMEMAMGSEDPSITVPMLSLAVTLYHLKRDVEAEQFALEAVRIHERAFGNKSLIYAEALDCLISIQARIGNDDADVLALLKRVLSIQEKELGYESEEVVTMLKKIVFYLEKMGKEEKLLLQRRLSMLRTKYKKKVHY
ncbi:hypothetical protein IFM89_026425, partial [Coptis chinensis]